MKVFPPTTQAHMVEYRVKDRSNIGTLYQHLETAMKDYHARASVPAQRRLVGNLFCPSVSKSGSLSKSMR